MDKILHVFKMNTPHSVGSFHDIVLVDETKKRRIDSKVEMWIEALESIGFKISKTKSIVYEIQNLAESKEEDLVHTDGQKVPGDYFRLICWLFIVMVRLRRVTFIELKQYG